MLAKVSDPLGVSVGDGVKISFIEANAIKSRFVLYILPLLLLMAGYFAGNGLAHRS